MIRLDHTPGRTANVNGRELLFFSGYSYLGMHMVPGFQALVKQGQDRYGFLFPSSRISNTQLDLFDEFESKLSAITGVEETVCFSSGFLAGRAVLETFKDQKIACMNGTHPAISFSGSTIEADMKKCAAENAVIAFDSVNPLAAEVNNTAWLKECPACTCIIDDSHGTGLINNGRGVSPSLSQGHEYVITYSLSKAWNITGGAVGCSKRVAQKLRSSPFYTASTAMSPALMYAFLEGQHLYEEQRARLMTNVGLFSTLTGHKLKGDAALPIRVLPGEITEGKLLREGFVISSFAYPDPSGVPVNRVVINALHTAEDLQRLAAALS